jgi:hypothetical protein
LERAGISNSDISIIANNGEGWYEKASEPGRIDSDGDGVDDRTEGAAAGAGIGGAVGGVVGAVLAAIVAVGSTIFLPGLNLVIAGPIAAALAGAGAGGATGGVIGALIGAGIPEYRAKVYEAGLRSGGILLGVEAKSDEEVEKLEELLTAIGAEHVRAE